MDQTSYNIAHLTQISSLTLAFVISVTILMVQLKRIQVQDSQFRQEKRGIICTFLLFANAYTVRTIITVLQMLDIFTAAEVGEFWMVQIEDAMCFVCEILPMFYFVSQHVYNFTGKDEIYASKMKMPAEPARLYSLNRS